jgi:NADPH:quinone reductase-like Zn-dependent oxidoreductase
MDTMTKTCFTEDLNIEVKATKPTRFKAGAELSGKVNKIGIEVDQNSTVDSDIIAFKLVISSEFCEKNKAGNCK